MPDMVLIPGAVAADRPDVPDRRGLQLMHANWQIRR
jgi:hypothetical protein